jgi:hypothetical protein
MRLFPSFTHSSHSSCLRENIVSGEFIPFLFTPKCKTTQYNTTHERTQASMQILVPASSVNISLAASRPKNGPEQYHILCALYQQHPRFREAADKFLSPADAKSLLSSEYKACEYRKYCVKLLKNVIVQRGESGRSFKNCGTGHHLAEISEFEPANRTRCTVFRCCIDSDKDEMAVHEDREQILLRQTCRCHKAREVELKEQKKNKQLEKAFEVISFEKIAATLEPHKYSAAHISNSCDGIYSTGHVSQYTDEHFDEVLDKLLEFDAEREDADCDRNDMDSECEELRTLSFGSSHSISSLLSCISDMSLKGLLKSNSASFVSSGNSSRLPSFRSWSDFASSATLSAFCPESVSLQITKNLSCRSSFRKSPMRSNSESKMMQK